MVILNDIGNCHESLKTERKCYMILELVNDMNKALDNNCYYAALSIALMLPDICSKAEFPEDKYVGTRYVKWFDQFIGEYEKSNNHPDELPYLNGEVIYSLRCSYLHVGNLNIKNEKIKNPRIDEFILIKEKKNQLDIYADTSYIDSNEKRVYEVNIRRLCMIIGNTAKGYYKKNKNKFNFFNYSIKSVETKEPEENIIDILLSEK